MNTFTTILNGRKLNQVLNLPDEYINAEVEVKVRVLKKHNDRKLSKFDLFFGVLKLDNIDEEIRIIREEWK